MSKNRKKHENIDNDANKVHRHNKFICTRLVCMMQSCHVHQANAVVCNLHQTVLVPVLVFCQYKRGHSISRLSTADYKEKLLEVIDASELPVRWGGRKVDPVTGDDACSSLVRGRTAAHSCYILRLTSLESVYMNFYGGNNTREAVCRCAWAARYRRAAI